MLEVGSPRGCGPSLLFVWDRTGLWEKAVPHRFSSWKRPSSFRKSAHLIWFSGSRPGARAPATNPGRVSPWIMFLSPLWSLCMHSPKHVFGSLRGDGRAEPKAVQGRREPSASGAHRVSAAGRTASPTPSISVCQATHHRPAHPELAAPRGENRNRHTRSSGVGAAARGHRVPRG